MSLLNLWATDKAVSQAEALCRAEPSVLGVLNDKVILPKRCRGLPRQTERGVVLSGARAACSALWRMLAVTAPISDSLAVSTF